MTTISILGYGNRGRLYGKLTSLYKNEMKMVAACDVNAERLKEAKTDCALNDDELFLGEDAFFKKGKLSDILVISTMDEDHCRHTLQALEMGYDILLEKPIATNEDEIMRIYRKAKETNRKVSICHVLRYTPFYYEMKKIVKSGLLGEIETISQTENVGYYHYAHSFVRGNWRNSDETCPIILAKCCHDLDLISWLLEKKCNRVSSFGELSYFKRENMPEGASERCKNCVYKDDCAFSCYNIYRFAPSNWIKMSANMAQTYPNIKTYLDKDDNPFGRCVFACDNNVADHQIVNMEFEDGKTASLNLNSFSGKIYRRTQVCGTKGEMWGIMEENTIYVHIYGQNVKKIKIKKPKEHISVHGGGDGLMLLGFVRYVESGKQNLGLTNLDQSLQSHLIAFAAEKSRVSDGEIQQIKF